MQDTSFTRVLVLEIGLNKDFRFLDRKKKLQKKKFCRPTDPNFFWHVTLNRGTFFFGLNLLSDSDIHSKVP